ncbi:helix-turn-helix domain-containing protein [Acinetobacter sp. S40]|uniref:AraC family transcriptional regulator n=1 Tax=Acinetobacter sp. S40 TaxID=2767434 RepID=UPI001909A3D2|nr:AraC family transcriptional regulator [Acinetobacter sp. S40]MBJ9984304.1 helix-turn-helix domain-containing protein [Acinetobacter sp. S40]
MSVKIIVGYVRLLHRVLQHYQLESLLSGSEQLTQWKQFTEALHRDSEQGFDLNVYVQLLKQLQLYFKRPVSLVMAEHASLQDVGMMGYLASTSLNLQQALYLLEQYYPLLFKQTNLERLKIVEQDQLIQILWSANYEDYREIYELNLAMIFKIAKLIVQEQLIPPSFIQLGLTPHLSLSHYEQFFGCKIQVYVGQYKICFDHHVLLARSFAADQQLNQVLSNQAKQSLQQTDTFEHRQQILKQKVWGFIEQGLKQQNEIVQEYVARQMHYSERTLQRQLKLYQLNFQDILDEYRLQLSQYYLQQGRSLVEIATLLGYADQSAFGRAFKRWTGQTPKQYLRHV